MKEIKGFIAGVLITLLLLNPVIALGEAVAENIEVYFNKVNININGVPQEIDNFIYNNTAYVPLKTISEVLGKVLEWNPETYTVNIKEATTNVEDTSKEPENRGNSVGNTVNGSRVTFERDWIYYINIKDRGNIYKMKTNGSEKTLVYDNYTSNLNLMEGWLYFSSYDENGFFKNIYKMKTDGSERIKLSEDSPSYMNVVGDWIFYSNINDGDKIYKMKTDGSCRTRINYDPSWNLIVFDGWIYYVSGNLLCKVKTDGSQKTVLLDEVHRIRALYVIDEWLYYLGDGVKPNELFRMKLDGTCKEQIY